MPCVPEFTDRLNNDGEERRCQPLQSESNFSGRRSTLSPKHDCQPRTRSSESGSSHRHPWRLRVSGSSSSWLCAVWSWRPLLRARWLPAAAAAAVRLYDSEQPRPEFKMTVNSSLIYSFLEGKTKEGVTELLWRIYHLRHHVMTSVDVFTSCTFIFIKGISCVSGAEMFCVFISAPFI